MKKRSMSILLASAMLASSLAVGAATVQAEEEKKDKYVIGMSQCNLCLLYTSIPGNRWDSGRINHVRIH